MNSTTKRLFISILVALIFAVSAATFWSLMESYRLGRTRAFHPSDKLASIEGWKIHRSNGNTRIYQASVERFSIERAKLGPFAIGPLHVARLHDVTVDFYLEGIASKPESARSPSETPSLPSAPPGPERTDATPDRDISETSHPQPDTRPSSGQAFGVAALEAPLADIQHDLLHTTRTTRVLEITNFRLSLWAEGKRVFRVSSDHATMNRRTGDLVFYGHATLDAADNGRIISYRITWVRKTSLFRITDPYILTRAGETKTGKVLETDYQLKTISYRLRS